MSSRAELRRFRTGAPSSTAIAAGNPSAPDQQYAAERYAAETEPAHADHYPPLDDRQHHAAYSEEGQNGERGEHDPRYASAAHDPRYAAGGHDKHGEYDPRYAEVGRARRARSALRRRAGGSVRRRVRIADDEDGYADEEPKRRNLLKIALAGGLGLVVVGTAGAFGYRAMFHGGSSDGPPPLIRADNTPTKVMPTASADAQSKPINDRLGNDRANACCRVRSNRSICAMPRATPMARWSLR